MTTKVNIDIEKPMPFNPESEATMHDAPEGLDYGSANTNEKYARTPVDDNWKECGKIQMGSTPNAEHEKAETLRMLGAGSHDPYYGSKHKNR